MENAVTAWKDTKRTVRMRKVLVCGLRNGALPNNSLIPSSNVWPCNPNIPEEMYAIFDPFGNATHTALSFEALGEDVLIAGAGPIGCMAAAIVKFSGARHVVVTDMNPYRLELARSWSNKNS